MSDWPHSPVHRLSQRGAYMITSATHHKAPIFTGAQNLTSLAKSLFELAPKYGWELQAWAVFPNHYHFVALSPENPETLKTLIRHLNSVTAIEVNQRTGVTGRKVWYQYWETHITYPGSYLARLNYVMNNPVRHGVVPRASLYQWCSAAWFEQRAESAFRRQVFATKTDRVSILDEYVVRPDDCC